MILHKNAILNKFSSSRGDLHYAGLSTETKQAISLADKLNRVVWIKTKPLFDNELIVFGTGGRVSLPESWEFSVRTETQSFSPDCMDDEISVLINGHTKGTVITGCSHSGLPAIVTAAEKICDKPIGYVIGGSHLFRANDEDINTVANFFSSRPNCKLYLGHCTGMVGFAKLYKAMHEKSLYPLHTGWHENINL